MLEQRNHDRGGITSTSSAQASPPMTAARSISSGQVQKHFFR
jgi:hypothetical protein